MGCRFRSKNIKIRCRPPSKLRCKLGWHGVCWFWVSLVRFGCQLQSILIKSPAFVMRSLSSNNDLLFPPLLFWPQMSWSDLLLFCSYYFWFGLVIGYSTHTSPLPIFGTHLFLALLLGNAGARSWWVRLFGSIIYSFYIKAFGLSLVCPFQFPAVNIFSSDLRKIK